MRLILLAAGLAAVTTAAAQLQIPNPLIRPRSITNPSTAPVPPPPESVAGRATPLPPYPTAGYGATVLPAGAGYADDPEQREINDLKERFSRFYVSAIVGRRAILRRSAAVAVNGNAGLPTATGNSMAPVPLGSGATVTTTRNDAMSLVDGQQVSAAGAVGTLIAHVDSHQVTIVRVHEGTRSSGARHAARNIVVFSGDIETSGTSAPLAIVLERTDPAFKRMISVETRARNASASPENTLPAPQGQLAAPPL